MKMGPNKTSFVFREAAKYTVKIFAALAHIPRPESQCLGCKVKVLGCRREEFRGGDAACHVQ